MKTMSIPELRELLPIYEHKDMKKFEEIRKEIIKQREEIKAGSKYKLGDKVSIGVFSRKNNRKNKIVHAYVIDITVGYNGNEIFYYLKFNPKDYEEDSFCLEQSALVLE